jgi:rhomboid family GlyGly-CTERM serine protease
MRAVSTGLRIGQEQFRAAMCVAVVGMVVVSIQMSQTTQALLEFDRHAVAAGQWWRIVTGNLVHYSWVHLVVDFGAFAIPCWLGRRRLRSLTWTALLSACAVGAGVYLWADSVITYRGLSGVNFAVLGYLLTILAREDRGWMAAVWVSLLLLRSSKAVLQMVTGASLIPTFLPDGVAVVGVAHVVGHIVGVTAGFAGSAPESTSQGPLTRTVPFRRRRDSALKGHRSHRPKRVGVSTGTRGTRGFSIPEPKQPRGTSLVVARGTDKPPGILTQNQ